MKKIKLTLNILAFGFVFTICLFSCKKSIEKNKEKLDLFSIEPSIYLGYNGCAGECISVNTRCCGTCSASEYRTQGSCPADYGCVAVRSATTPYYYRYECWFISPYPPGLINNPDSIYLFGLDIADEIPAFYYRVIRQLKYENDDINYMTSDLMEIGNNNKTIVYIDENIDLSNNIDILSYTILFYDDSDNLVHEDYEIVF
jgi:hypothetical protein